MNGEFVGRWFRFEPTITLGTVAHLMVWTILFITAWVHISDRVDANEKVSQAHQDIIVKQQQVMQQMQLDEMRTSTILSQVETDLARDENKIDQLEQKH